MQGVRLNVRKFQSIGYIDTVNYYSCIVYNFGSIQDKVSFMTTGLHVHVHYIT